LSQSGNGETHRGVGESFGRLNEGHVSGGGLFLPKKTGPVGKRGITEAPKGVEGVERISTPAKNKP